MNRPTNIALDAAQHLTEQAASKADDALQSSQRVVDATIESLRADTATALQDPTDLLL